ncbi:metallophosphoesterase [Rubellimicrobium roseum]|uniref:Serine/threonine protein phosphatase n=1 Tax=Rubellimicrobium roseum TaxID=687525 RepID=A0A5C4NDL1_9RHOB|nr:metallophosphoesterase [Rubellimicrobium roseum]TNC66853.1 serine/threonine protein phosphatase [Rubellimicrobium roseum]
MKRLLDLFGRRRAAPVPFDAPLAPAEPLAVIGDVHGRDDLLARLLDRLGREAPDHRVILVGDYLDRGEGSAAVLRRLPARPDLVCLKGNHEAMCLGFLEDPPREGRRWLANGGLQTLASFGVGGLTPTSGPEPLYEARDRLAVAMGEELIGWVQARPLHWASGNVAVTHAGADPALPMEEQDRRALLWGHPRFAETPRVDGLWIVHGHTIVPEPLAEAGRVAIDTGAYATGRLTAALIGPGELRFLST